MCSLMQPNIEGHILVSIVIIDKELVIYIIVIDEFSFFVKFWEFYICINNHFIWMLMLVTKKTKSLL